MEANVVQFLLVWKQMSCNSNWTEQNLTFMVHLQQQKIVLKLLKYVCCDFTDSERILLPVS